MEYKIEKANFLYEKLISLANRVHNLRESNGLQKVDTSAQVCEFDHLKATPHSEIGATDDRRMYLEESTDVTPVEEAVTDCGDHPNCENVDIREENACSNKLGAPEAVQPEELLNMLSVADDPYVANTMSDCGAHWNMLSTAGDLSNAKAVRDSEAHWSMSSTAGDLSNAKAVSDSVPHWSMLSTAGDLSNVKAVSDSIPHWNMLSTAGDLSNAKAVSDSVPHWNMLPVFLPTLENLVCSDDGSCLNRTHYVETHKRNEAFGMQLPDDTTFMDIYLESALNQEKMDTNNYFYYLYDGDCNTMGAGYESMNYHTFDKSDHSSIEFDGMNCNVGNGTDDLQMHIDDHETFESCSNDDTIDLDILNCDTDTVSTVESSNTHVSLVQRESCETQPTSKVKDKTPWKIVIKPNTSSDDTNMIVPVSGRKSKLYFCIFCQRRVTKFARHLEDVHKAEDDVKEFMVLPIGSNQRKELIGLILKRGQFEWNSRAELNAGQFSTCRRPNQKFERTADYFTPCPKCLGSFSTNTLSRHFKKCSNNALNGERKVKQLSRAVDGRLHPSASDDLKNKIFPKLKEDPCVRSIRFDWAVIAFSNDLCLRHHAVFQHKLIRDKIRGIAKVFAAAKSISTAITEFSSLFHVKHSIVAIEAVRKVAKFDMGAKSFGSPGTATTLVTLIKDIADFMKTEYMRLDKPMQERDTKRFIKVFTKDAKLKINKIAADTQAKARRRRKVDIPSTDDVNRFITYLDDKVVKSFTALSEGYTYEKWVCLSELTLVSILAFNRKRTGEMRNITVVDFQTRELLAEYMDKLVKGEIPEHTSRLIKSRILLRGKKDREVEILLKHFHDDSLDLLVRHREDARIPDTNEFLFALYSATGEPLTVESCVAVSNFSKQCNAENPESLRGTKLRKHLASMCALMGLSDPGVTNVAKFMGHDDEIHRNIYRHNTLGQQVTQITEILERARGKDVNVSKNEATAESTQIRTKVFEAEKSVNSKRKTTKTTPPKEDPRTNPTKHQNIVATPGNQTKEKNKAAKVTKLKKHSKITNGRNAKVGSSVKKKKTKTTDITILHAD